MAAKACKNFGPLLSAFLEIFDVVTDLGLVVAYAQRGQYVYFALLLFFVLMPAIIMTTISWRFFNHQEKKFKPSRPIFIARRVLLVLQLGPAVHWLNKIMQTRAHKRAMYDPNKQTKLDDYLQAKEDAERTGITLGLVEGFLEAAPQLFIQYYIIMTQGEETETPEGWPELPFILNFGMGISMLLSFYSLASSTVEYQQTVLGEVGISTRATMVQYAWHGLTILSRSSAVLLILTSWKGALIVGFIFVVHWALSFVLLWKTLPKKEDWLSNKIWFKAFMAYVYIFTFFCAHEGKWIPILCGGFYVVYLGQNLLFNFLRGPLHTQGTSAIKNDDLLIMILSSSYILIIPAIIAMAVYYWKYRPWRPSQAPASPIFREEQNRSHFQHSNNPPAPVGQQSTFQGYNPPNLGAYQGYQYQSPNNNAGVYYTNQNFQTFATQPYAQYGGNQNSRITGGLNNFGQFKAMRQQFQKLF